MPFIYRSKPANIDRSRRREDEFIYNNVEKALREISRSSESHHIRIMPAFLSDPPFKKANPDEYLVLYCLRDPCMSMYEVEHWLDNLLTYESGFSLEKISIVYIDERRKYYKSPHGPFISNSIKVCPR